MTRNLGRLRSWEGLLLVLLLLVVALNTSQSAVYFSVQNWINLFQLSIEKIIIALVMAFIIINGEIDLSVASMAAFSACVLAFLFKLGVPFPLCIAGSLLAGILCGAFNGFWVAFAGLPSLVVTLAGLIMYRGLARVLVEDRSYGGYPDWFTTLGQQPLLGPLPLSLILFCIGVVVAVIVLAYSGFGRYVYVIGNNKAVALYSGVRVHRVKMILFIASGFVSALAGVMLAARLGSVRGDVATGFELDIITMVLLGGVSIFGGAGTIYGVLLSILLILTLRNGMGLQNISGNTQTGVIGVLLILSVLVPNLLGRLQETWKRRREAAPVATALEERTSNA